MSAPYTADDHTRFTVVPHGTRHRVQDCLDDRMAKDAPLYMTREDAQRWADHKNAANRKAMRRE